MATQRLAKQFGRACGDLPSFVFSRGIGLLSHLGLRAPMSRALARVLPRSVLRIMKQAATRAKVRHGGLSLVDQSALERKYREALSLLISRGGAEALGDYLEFGVFTGDSMVAMHRALASLGLTQVRLFGFDSFEGLPDAARVDDGGYWTPGACSSDEAFTRRRLTSAGIDWSRSFLVKGWFSETLNADLMRRYGIRKASVIMVDCDLYQSAKEALAFCAPLIGEEAVIFFDDMTEHIVRNNLGEKRAFDEFLRANPHLRAEPLGTYGNDSLVFAIFSAPRPPGDPGRDTSAMPRHRSS